MKPFEYNPEYKMALVADLIPYARNSRTHTDDQITKVASSIKEFGFLNPVIVDGDNGIIAGHCRILAAKKLGIFEVPTIEASHLSEAQKKAYIITDNRLALDAGWDDEMLKLEIAELDEMDFDLSLTGFNDDELAEFLKEDTVGLTDEDAVPELPETPVSVLGDIWILGNHRLMCGDSTSIDAVEKLMDGQKADMVFTDPPYGIDVVGAGKSFGTVGAGNKVAANQYSPIIGDETTETAEQFIQTCNALGFYDQIIWGGNYFTSFLPPRKGWVVWDKKGREWNDNFSDFEMAWSSYEKPAKIFTHVWMGMVQSGEREKRVHPTQKPSGLIIDCIEYFDKEAIKVFDGFGGSGTTLIACEKTLRSSYNMELDPKYCDVIVKRYQEFTGKQAIHAETGKPFNELANGG
jgi:hypothetical protein